MSHEDLTPSPAATWWSGWPDAPAASAVPLPASAPEPARRGSRALLSLALLAGAAGGAGAAVLLRHDQPAQLASGGYVLRSGAGVQPVSSSPVAGTPESAAAAIAPSVVTVEVTGTQTVNSFGFGPTQQVSDTGSGVVLRADGYILTNNHVIAAAIDGGTVQITLNDGRTLPATIIGHDSTSDLAVIRAGGVKDLKPATFADSERLVVGQAVLAVGAPLGLSNTVTQGIVSTLHRPVATGEAGASSQSVIDAVQTDAAINPGNSGGALVDLAGRVVGINSAIASTGSSLGGGQAGNIGVGFAIPSDDAARVGDMLIATGHATHSQMGVSVANATRDNGAPGLGATLRDVAPGGPAARAGLQADDLVTKVGDRRVTDANSLIVAIRAHAPGESVPVTFSRGGAVRTVRVTLSSAQSG